VRYFLTRGEPSEPRILVVESGSRSISDQLLPRLYSRFGGNVPIDLITCFSGVPGNCDPRARVYRVSEYQGRAGRRKLFRELAARRYSILAMLCSAEPIMTKWKWALAARLPVKVLVVNENCDCFWLDYAHHAAIRHFVAFRAGLTGSGAAATLASLVLFPFTLTYLLLYAATVHIRRALR